MPLDAVAIVLTAALLHALWNMLLARSMDTGAAIAVAMVAGSLVVLPFALASGGSSRPPCRSSPRRRHWSSLLRLFAYAYRIADLSLVYPIARGLAPVLVLVGSVLVLGQTRPHPGPWWAWCWSPSGSSWCAACAHRVGSGVAAAVGIAVPHRGLHPGRPAGRLTCRPGTYLALVVGIPAVVCAAGWSRTTAAWQRLRAATTPAVLVGGIAVVAAYGLVLVALGMAPAAGVSALRETSIVMATVLAAVLLNERVERSRWLGLGRGRGGYRARGHQVGLRGTAQAPRCHQRPTATDAACGTICQVPRGASCQVPRGAIMSCHVGAISSCMRPVDAGPAWTGSCTCHHARIPLRAVPDRSPIPGAHDRHDYAPVSVAHPRGA